jgi:predicted ABC-type transport system involved in lysophospholipase L1 biosynthesis ATPase subunit
VINADTLTLEVFRRLRIHLAQLDASQQQHVACAHLFDGKGQILGARTPTDDYCVAIGLNQVSFGQFNVVGVSHQQYPRTPEAGGQDPVR